MPTGGRVCSPIGSVYSSWLDNHRQQRPTVCRYIFDRSHSYSFNVSASIFLRIVSIYNDFNGAEYNITPVSSIL